jgi:hypothetical protein
VGPLVRTVLTWFHVLDRDVIERQVPSEALVERSIMRAHYT